MRSSTVSAGDTATAAQYNNLRKDAQAASYLLAHEQSSPDMTLYVEAGTYVLKETYVSFAGGNTPTVTAPVSNNRIDVLTIDTAGTLAWTTGTSGASPSAPTVPQGKIPICFIYVRSTSTTLRDTDGGSTTGYIYQDLRPFISKAQTVDILKIAGSTSGIITIQGAAAAGTWTMTLPTDDGGANQFLKTDGNGVTSWGDPSGDLQGYGTGVIFVAAGSMGLQAGETSGIENTFGVVGAKFADGSSIYKVAACRVPVGYTSISGIKVYHRNGYAATRNLYLKFETTRLKLGADRTNDGTDSLTTYSAGTTAGEMSSVTVPSGAFDGIGTIAAGEYIGIIITRDSSSGNDTYNDDWYVTGVEFTFA